MRALFSCAVLAASMGFVATTEAFVVSSSAGVRGRSQRRQQTQEVAAETKATETRKKWDGNSWPAENERRKAVPADTKDWEMENTHVEVWEDRPNPTTDLTWWENYAPSKEEVISLPGYPAASIDVATYELGCAICRRRPTANMVFLA